MFGTLFFKECKQTVKSLAFWAYVACLILFFVSQLGETDWRIIKPQPGHEGEYGHTYSTDEGLIITKTLRRLTEDYAQNSYTTYPFGFYKRVFLGEKKKAQMGEILAELTGKPVEELEQLGYDYINEESDFYKEAAKSGIEIEMAEPPTPDFEDTLAEGVSFERFLELMEEVDDLLGGGSMYAPARVKNGVQVPQTYEGALKEYQDIIEKDRYSGAFARLFCDYMGLMVAILPVFPAVARTLRDKRSKALPALYSKQASSACILLARYLALLTATMVPIVALAGFAQIQCSVTAGTAGISADTFAFFKYVGGWMFPTATFTLAMGLFVSELTGSVAAILVQGILWFTSVFQSIDTLIGNFGLKLIPRFNSLGNTELFERELSSLIGNRIFYGILSLILIASAVFVYDWKRKGGGIHFGSLRKNK
ncbi:MAG: ABC transporter permease subunit [Lachnospiraceae bacterium]|nr:ABC transporter permease subunit [Lachnospiraceae bacterium]